MKQMALGCYLDASVNICPAMTAEILKENRHTVYQSTYRQLIAEELEAPGEAWCRNAFDTASKAALGVPAKDRNFLTTNNETLSSEP